MPNINVLSDILIINELLKDDRLYKKAGLTEDFLSQAKDYFANKISKTNPMGSVVDLLAPGLVVASFSAIGFGGVGILLGILMTSFDIHAETLIEPLCSAVKSMIADGKPISSSQVSSAAASAAQQYNSSSSSDTQSASFANLMRTTRILKLAAIDFEHQNLRLLLNDSQPQLSKLAAISVPKDLVVSIMSKIFGLIISVILWSAGLLVVGDIIRKFLGESPSFQAEEGSGSGAGPTATQKKFILKSDQNLPGSIPMENTPENIDNFIVQCAKDVYNGLDGKESIIRSTAAFQEVKNLLVEYNWNNKGAAFIFIPNIFSSKKRMVDNFIDEVAQKSA